MAESEARRPWTPGRLAAGCFWVYLTVLVVAARMASHHVLSGWPARLATMAAVAVGLLPWMTWLRPRLVRALDLFGRVGLVISYLVLLAPFAWVARAVGDPLRMRRPTGGSRWLARRVIRQTIEAAQQEF